MTASTLGRAAEEIRSFPDGPHVLLADFRAVDKQNAEYYGRHTVTKAQAELQPIKSTHEHESRTPGGIRTVLSVPGYGGRMDNVTPHNLVRDERGQAREELTPTGKTDDASQRTRLVVCLLLVPSDAEPIVALLEQLAASSQIPVPFPSFSDSGRDLAAVHEDLWLEHAEAAKCLGISKSTLYRYVSQQRIECRKIAGRLEYRQSALEKLKREHIRPARLSHHAGGIIPSALSSGK